MEQLDHKTIRFILKTIHELTTKSSTTYHEFSVSHLTQQISHFSHLPSNNSHNIVLVCMYMFVQVQRYYLYKFR